MPETQLQRHYREAQNLRIGPEMAKYITAKLQTTNPSQSITIIAANARTGLPVQHEVNSNTLSSSPAPNS